MSKRRTVQYRRKREGRTDYAKRLSTLKGRKDRLVVRISNKNILAQIVKYEPSGDKILCSANSSELVKLGWKFSNSNMPTAYLVGLLLASKGKAKEAVLDTGLSSPSPRTYALLKGAVEGGIEIPHDESVYPDDLKISGKHIEEYQDKLAKDDPDKHQKLFSSSSKAGIKITANFQEIKDKIMAEVKK